MADYDLSQASAMLEEQIEKLREQYELQRKLYTLQTEGTDRILQGMSRISKLRNEINISMMREKEISEELKAIEDARQDAYIAKEAIIEKLTQEKIESLRQSGMTEQEIKDSLDDIKEDVSKNNQNILNTFNEQLSKIGEIEAALKEEQKQVQKRNKLMQGGATAVEKTFDNIFSKFSGWSDEDWDNNPLAQLLTSDNGDLLNFLKGAELALLQTLENPQRLLGDIAVGVAKSFIRANQEMLKGLDEQSAALAALTGRQREYGYVLEDAFAGQQRYAMSIEDTGKAFGSLYDKMSDFSDMTKETQASLTQYVAKMDKLNISNTDASNLLDTLNNSFGYLGDTGTKVFDRLVAGAIKLGMAPAEVTRAFNQNRSVLARYGDEAVEVFEDILAASKETGIGVDELFNKFSQYDTFEGAAQAAGKLNAVLGGNILNATELLLANEAERVKMLQESLQISGLQYDLLSKFEKMAIGEAMGIQDIDTLNRLFQDSNQQISEREKVLDSLGVSQEEINKAMGAATTVTERLEALMSSLAVTLMPLVEAVNYVIDAFLSMNEATEGYLFPAIFATIGVIAAFAAGFNAAIIVPILAIVGAIVVVVKYIKNFREQLPQMKKALMGLVPVLVTIGIIMGVISLPMLKIIAVVVLLGLVIRELAKNFEKYKKIVMDLISGPLERINEALGSVSDSTSGLSFLWDALSLYIEVVTEVLVTMVGYILKALVGLVAYVIKVGVIVYNLFQSLYEGFQLIMDGNFAEGFRLIVDSIVTFILEAFGNMLFLIYDIFAPIIDLFAMIWDSIFDGIWSTKNIVKSFSEFGKAIHESVMVIADWIIEGFQKAWDRVFGNTIWGVSEIKEALSNILKAMKEVLAMVVDIILLPFKTVWGMIFGEGGEWSAKNIKKQFVEIVGMIKDTLLDLMEGLTSPFNKALDTLKAIVEKYKEIKVMEIKAELNKGGGGAVSVNKPPANTLYRASYEFGRAVGQAVFGPGGESMSANAPILSGALADNARRGVAAGAASASASGAPGAAVASGASGGATTKTLIVQLVMDGETISRKVIEDIESQFNLKQG